MIAARVGDGRHVRPPSAVRNVLNRPPAYTLTAPCWASPNDALERLHGGPAASVASRARGAGPAWGRR
ncbi:MAG: hypothetical protein E6J41_23660 [Chloroflexi bacterium]|nr:MAG: hypothetical protein E6J41_23660 [Chloroflexota bacterium]